MDNQESVTPEQFKQRLRALNPTPPQPAHIPTLDEIRRVVREEIARALSVSITPDVLAKARADSNRFIEVTTKNGFTQRVVSAKPKEQL